MERRGPSRVSDAQWGILIEFLERNPNLARTRGYNNSARGRAESIRLWQEVANLLNAEGSGTIKSPKEWSVYISNYKCKLKKIVADINRDANATGGGPPRAANLSETDSRFLALLGPGFGQQTAPRVRVQPFPEPPSTSTGAESVVLFEVEEVPQSQEEVVETTEAPLQEREDPPVARVPSLTPTMDNPPLMPHRSSRQRRQRTRPLAPLDEARRVLAEVELRRGAADEANARAHELLAHHLAPVADVARHLGRLADVAERYLEYLISLRS